MIKWFLEFLPDDAGGWIGLIGGLVALGATGVGAWRRRVRIAVDYYVLQDESGRWHEITLTNMSDLPVSFKFIGPWWVFETPIGWWISQGASEDEGNIIPLTRLEGHASSTYLIEDQHWRRPLQRSARGKLRLRVGIEFPIIGKIKWLKPRDAPPSEHPFMTRIIMKYLRLSEDTEIPNP